jgi:hypothetical protein
MTLALALTLGLASFAFALTAGNADGVWGNPTPSNTSSFRWCYGPDNLTGPAGGPSDCDTSDPTVQNASITDENQFRYGSPSSGSGSANRSGYGFNGNNNVGSVAANVPFFLGRFTHYNRPITADDALTGIGLTVTLTGLKCDDDSDPAEGPTQSFDYTFTHEETPNNPANNPGGVCPYGDSTGNGCDDRVTVSQQPDTTFTCPEGLRTVQILGFFTNASCHLSYTGSPSTSFITGESQENPACLWARISDPETPFAVTLNAFEAQWVEDRVLVTWDTTSEIDNLGFNLYRSQSPDQVGELITAQMVPSQAPGSPQGYFYSFDDAAVAPGETYWYTLEDLDLFGTATQHGPVSAVPQIPTAVTLSSLSAAVDPGMPLVGLGLAALTLVLLSGLVLLRQRQGAGRTG